MAQVQGSRILQVNKDQLFDIVKSTAAVHKFNPAVKSSPRLGSKQMSIGSKRKCEMYDGNYVIEEVTAYAVGDFITYDIIEGTMPFKKAKATMKFVAKGNKATEVSILMEAEPKFGILGKMMFSLMMKPMMKKMFSDVLKGLEAHATLGIVIDKKVPNLATA